MSVNVVLIRFDQRRSEKQTVKNVVEDSFGSGYIDQQPRGMNVPLRTTECGNVDHSETVP